MAAIAIYLCGPINGCSDSESKDWRELVKSKYANCIDPMRRDYRGVELVDYREIVDLDKRDVEAADVVMVNYDKPSVGTSMEVYHAWLKGVPVVVVCRADAVISPWLRYHSTKIVHSFDDALAWVAKATA